MKKLFNWKIILVFVIFLSALLRIHKIDTIPYGSTQDEVVQIYNAYSIWETGKDIEGRSFPLSFNAHSSMSPVGIYLTAPFVGLFELNLFWGRLPSVLVGVGSVFIIFLLGETLFKKKEIGILAALVFSISPWAIHMSRGNWDVNFAMFFYLLGILVFIKNIKNWKFIYALIPFLLGFYSYHATKVFFVLAIPLMLFFYFDKLKERKKQLIIFALLSLFILVSFVGVSRLESVTRQEVNIFNSPEASKMVDSERERNTAPWMLRVALSNKPLYYLRQIRENYLEAFSTEFLFLYGETNARADISSIFYRGQFYIIELPLLLLGIFYLFTKVEKRARILIVVLLLISPLSSTFTIDKNFANRNIMMLPFLILIISLGLYYLIKVVSGFKRGYKIIFLSALFLLYLFMVTSYIYQYFFRWPVYGAEAWGGSSRDLAKIASEKKELYDNIYISNSGKHFLIQYAFFNKIDPEVIQKAWFRAPIKIDSLIFLDTCFDSDSKNVEEFLPEKSLYIASSENCKYDSTPLEKIMDRGQAIRTIWNMYENR